MKFSEVPLGAKVMHETLYGESLLGRKVSRKSLQVLSDERPNIFIGPDKEVELVEQPHADGDFSYLCDNSSCRCRG